MGLSCATRNYLQVHGNTIPKVHTQPVGIIAFIKGPTGVIEFIAESQFLRFSKCVFPGLNTVRCVGIDQSAADALEQRNVFSKAVWVRFAAVIDFG